jgi:dephospho-CoA kinase
VRLALADDVMLNEGGLDDLAEQVRELHDTYLSLARSAPWPDCRG